MQMTFATTSKVSWINLNNKFLLLQYNENIKNHNVPENSEPEKKRKAKFYNNLRLDQCEKNPKTNSELTSFLFRVLKINWIFHKEFACYLNKFLGI